MKESKEELISRRKFFKKGSLMLPLIGMLIISPLVVSCDPLEEPAYSGGSSSSACGGCANTCISACSDYCRAGASYTPVSCNGSCKAACEGSCRVTCMHSCKYGSK